MSLINAHGDAERVQEILTTLEPAQLDELKHRNNTFGSGTDWIASSVPANQQAEVSALLANKRGKEEQNPAADGAHVAELFSDPAKRLNMRNAFDDQMQRDLTSHTAENIIGELREKTPQQILAARSAWETAHPGQSWDSLIEKRFGDGDANTYLRMKALASGDRWASGHMRCATRCGATINARSKRLWRIRISARRQIRRRKPSRLRNASR
jgi:hypothetical protein